MTPPDSAPDSAPLAADVADTEAERRPPPRRRRALPGELDRRRRMERMIRVDHAGEYGARRIYQGQLAVLGEGEKGDILRHMAEQEEAHLAEFDRLIVERGVRPSLMHPVWHVAGFALGAGTALLGERAAMACTVAVEEVIDRHYAEQAEFLADDAEEAELRATIERFRAEELEHRDIGLEHEAELAPAYRALSAVIKVGSRAAIWVAERV
jgi:ubiquinone biosynthesis monooxygenase Coq7